jgi:hypothetical protein
MFPNALEGLVLKIAVHITDILYITNILLKYWNIVLIAKFLKSKKILSEWLDDILTTRLEGKFFCRESHKKRFLREYKRRSFSIRCKKILLRQPLFPNVLLVRNLVDWDKLIMFYIEPPSGCLTSASHPGIPGALLRLIFGSSFLFTIFFIGDSEAGF